MLSFKSLVVPIVVLTVSVSCGRAPAPDEVSPTYQRASRGVTSGPARLLRNFPGPASAGKYLSAINFAKLGKLLIFTGAGTEGRELWKSDGTSEGTALLKDIWPGTGGAPASSFTEVNDTLYFVANDGVRGAELWKTDGTSTGTVLVKDICALGCDSNPSRLTNVNGTLFFRANDGLTGEELWKSDGTEAGTVLVKDINPGPASSKCEDLTSLNGMLLFSANDPAAGDELWKSDGTAAGTVMVKDIYPGAIGSMSRDRTSTLVESTLGPDVSLHHIRSVGNVAYLVADDWTHGPELWKTDGTEAGTVLVKDIVLTGRPSFVTELTDVEGELFFVADDGIHGSELWKSDGTDAGTVLVADIAPGSDDSRPTSMMNLDGRLIFQASAPGTGLELWQSDGTTVGTTLIKDLMPGNANSTLSNFFLMNHALFFLRKNGAVGSDVWKTDGTPGGTHIVQSASRDLSIPHALLGVNGRVFFQHGPNLWIFDESTGQGSPIIPSEVFNAYWWQNSHLVNINGTVFFEGNDGLSQDGLWRTDGTEAGTVPIKTPGTSVYGCLMNANGTLVFPVWYSRSYDYGSRLWRSDGTDAGTFELSMTDFMTTSLFSPAGCDEVTLQKSLYFTGALQWGSFGLWKTDGTTAGTSLVKEISSGLSSGEILRVGDLIFFTDPNGQPTLWVSDGTTSGTLPVRQFNAPASSRTSLVLMNGIGGFVYMYFTADKDPWELWKSDGTVAGTVLIESNAPILWPRVWKNYWNSYCYSSSLLYDNSCADAGLRNSIVELNGAAYLLADGGSRRMQLRRVDEGGTVVIKEFAPLIHDGNPLVSGLLSLNGALYFTAYDPVFGAELWTSDGTPDGTVLLKDIEPGIMSSVPGEQFRVGDAIALQAADAHGLELWRSGRTASSTVLVQDIAAGGQPSQPRSFTRSGDNVLFTAFDENGVYGIYVVPATEIDTPPQIVCPNEVIVDATDDEGAYVPFAAEASDIETVVTPTYSQEPGSYFPIGTRTVTATVVDGLGTTVSCSFPVTVRVGITCPTDLTVEATSSAGAPVSFEAQVVSPTTTVAYSSEPGSTFPLGTTMVTATATDARGRHGNCSFNVNVVDTTPPALSLQDLTVESPTPDGVNVEYPALVATDAVSLPSVVATPESGSLFPIGTTPVAVVATDAAGNRSEAAFTVTVVLARHRVKSGCDCSSGEAWSGAVLLLGLVARRCRKRE